jgi:hypothetical protein
LNGEFDVTRIQIWAALHANELGLARLVLKKPDNAKLYYTDCSYDSASQVAEIDQVRDVPELNMWVRCDARIITHDGLRYDLRTPGDYYLAFEDDNGLSQLITRHMPHPTKPGAALIEAVAAYVDNTLVEIYSSDRTVYVMADHWTSARHMRQTGYSISPARSAWA